MIKAIGIALVLVLAGCFGLPRRQLEASPCAAGEASYACQVERYRNVNVD